MTADGWTHFARSDRVALTRAGFDLVHRLGLSELRELLRSDAAPSDYLDAAGVL